MKVICFCPGADNSTIHIRIINEEGVTDCFGEILGGEKEYRRICKMFSHLNTSGTEYRVDDQLADFLVDTIKRKDVLNGRGRVFARNKRSVK